MIDINSAWQELKAQIKNCNRCGLCQTRTNVVVGEGPEQNCKVMFVGEGPGEEEDKSGRPFVGPAGQMLTKVLTSGNIPRESVYITNTVKCRPPNNRNPNQQELIQCRNFLDAQILLLNPKIIVTLGAVATHWLLTSNSPMKELRGQWYKLHGIDLFPMFHPSYLLREESKAAGSPKDLTWRDIRVLKAKLDEIG